MSRYIDADHLIWRATTYYNPNGKTEEEMYPSGWDCTCQTESDFVEYVNEEPSIDLEADYVPKDFHDKTCEAMAKRHQEEIADMVSVVRCKECKEWDKNDHECYLDRGGLYFPNADDYCSFGEREGE